MNRTLNRHSPNLKAGSFRNSSRFFLSTLIAVMTASLTGCVTEQREYLMDFHYAFFIILAIVIGMAIFGYIFSRRQYKKDKAEEKDIKRTTGTGTPTR